MKPNAKRPKKRTTGSRESTSLPIALTVIKAIALSDGVLRGGERYMTKYQMIELCRKWLASRRMRVQIADREVHARRDARQGSFRK